MASTRPVHAGRGFVGRLVSGRDLLEGLTAACVENAVTMGRIEAIGTVQRACLGYFNQATRQYEFLGRTTPLEITNLTGNVSLRDGKPMVHAHITLADEQGKAFGGHLAPGTVVFACEFVIQEFSGEPLTREPDPETGLAMWRM